MIGVEQSFYLLLSLVLAAVASISILYFLLSWIRIPAWAVRNVVLLVSIYILAGFFNFLIADLTDRYEVDIRGVIFHSWNVDLVFIGQILDQAEAGSRFCQGF